MGDERIVLAGTEVRVRILIAKDPRHHEIDYTFEEINAQMLRVGTDMTEKLEMSRAKRALRLGKRDEAIAWFDKVEKYCLEVDNRYHARSASRLALSAMDDIPITPIY